MSWTAQKILKKNLKKKPGGGGLNFQSSGNFMNCRENRYIFLTPPPDGEF